jgi:hypothetical protein
VQLDLTLEPMESVLVVFNKAQRQLPPRLTREALASGRIIPVTGGPVDPPKPPWPIIEPSPTKMLTLSPVAGNKFDGVCTIPADVNLATARVVLEADEIAPEAAARVTINGKDAGGFIGRPLRLDVTKLLQPGTNRVAIAPFTPKSVRLKFL